MAGQLNNEIDVTKLYDYAKELADLYREEIQNSDSKASGTLYNFQYDVQFQKNGFRIVFLLPHYWYYLEYGRMPTQNSEGGIVYPKILNWVKVKGIQPAKAGESQESLAYAITTKIHKAGYFGYGHHGKHLLRESLDRAKSSGLIERLLNSVADEYGKQIQVDISDLQNLTKKS